jgi:diguanylate cyclase (GGDEF)-like protein
MKLTALITITYYLTGFLGQLVAIPPGNVTPIWPPSGIALAAALIYKRKAWPGIFLGALLTNAHAILIESNYTIEPQVLMAFLLIAVGSLLQPIAGERLIFHKLHGKKLPDTISEYLIFIFLIPCFCLISSSIGVFSLYSIAGAIPADNLINTWSTWWIGDSIGVLLFTPLLMSYHHRKTKLSQLSQSTPHLLFLIGATALAFGLLFDKSANYPFAYLPLPILFFIAITRSNIEVLVALLVLAFSAAVITIEGYGPFVHPELNTSLLLLQGYIMVSAISANLMSVIQHEKSVAKAKLKDLNRSLRDQITERTRELESEKERAVALAMQDPLTELFNRRAFYQQASSLLKQAERHQRPLSLLLADIDHFKAINDTFGHDIGDQALKTVANLLHKNMRTEDLCARFGGEEFIALLPDTGRDAALNLAQRINQAIKSEIVDANGQEVVLTISIGVACSLSGNTLEAMIKSADNALYQAKDNGRDQVCLAKDSDQLS